MLLRPYELIKRAQEAMQVLGIYSGKIDGVIGIRTQAALKNWQEKNAMTPSEIIDISVVKRLEKAAGGVLLKLRSNAQQKQNDWLRKEK